jgi:two-component system phosphate regulon response regulator PhoB
VKVASLEDEPAQAQQIQGLLLAQGHQVFPFSEGRKLIRHLETDELDLLVLDWHIPDISGLEVLRWVRERLGRELPVLFLTSFAQEDEIVTALDAGADDYLSKPLRPREFNARIAALLRRTQSAEQSASMHMSVGRYEIDFVTRTVTRRGESIALSPREFDIAAILFRNLGKIMPRDLLVKLIWGKDLAGSSRSLDTHVYRVRQKLSLGLEHGVRLRTIYTHGYCLEAWNEAV